MLVPGPVATGGHRHLGARCTRNNLDLECFPQPRNPSNLRRLNSLQVAVVASTSEHASRVGQASPDVMRMVPGRPSTSLVHVRARPPRACSTARCGHPGRADRPEPLPFPCFGRRRPRESERPGALSQPLPLRAVGVAQAVRHEHPPPASVRRRPPEAAPAHPRPRGCRCERAAAGRPARGARHRASPV